VRRALDAMAGFGDLTWVLMPGNHDSLAAVDLWERIARDKPDNVLLALAPEIIPLGAHAAILPAPPTVRNPGRDLTDWMAGAETCERLRIGLAHGGVTGFGSEEDTAEVIPPDRADTARLDYLALGDWHGQKSINPRTWYSGAPEADSFKGHAPAGALLVELTAPGAPPQVTPVPTGQFTWTRLHLDCFAGTDPVPYLMDVLPDAGRDKVLLALQATGRLTLLEHSRLRAACAGLADAFHVFEADLDRLGIEQDASDLDLIAESGALRAAADSLLAATDPTGRTAEDAQIARIALTHLFHLAQAEEP
jgi:hypothetical protein